MQKRILKKCPLISSESLRKIIKCFIELENNLPEYDRKRSLTVYRIIKSIPEDINKNDVLDFINLKISRKIIDFKRNESLIGLSELERQKRINTVLKIKNHTNDEELINKVSELIKNNSELDIKSTIKRLQNINGSVRNVVKEYVSGQNKYSLVKIDEWNSSGKMEKNPETKKKEMIHSLFDGTKWCVKFKDSFLKYTKPTINNDCDLGDNCLYLVEKNDNKFCLCHKGSPLLNTNNDDLKREDIIEILPLIREYEWIICPGVKCPEVENIIKKYASKAYYYASEVLKSEWIEGEEAILKNSRLAYEYSMFVKKDRMPLAEIGILNECSNKEITDYFHSFISKIDKEADMSYKMFVNKMINDPVLAYDYACYLKEAGSFFSKEERAVAEKSLSVDTYYINLYAINILKSRCEKIEKNVLKDTECAIEYAEKLIKGRWKELEDKIRKKKNPMDIWNYSRVSYSVLKQRSFLCR